MWFRASSRVDKFLDPLADKLLTIAAMCMFCQWGVFPAWALMIVLTREFAVTGLRLVAVQKGNVIAAGWSGKVKTASTMVGLISYKQIAVKNPELKNRYLALFTLLNLIFLMIFAGISFVL